MPTLKTAPALLAFFVQLTRRDFLYLIRKDGSADILPREALPEGLETFIAEKFEIERSSFL